MRFSTAVISALLFSLTAFAEPYDAVSRCIDMEQTKPGYTWSEAWNKCKDAPDKSVKNGNPYDNISVAKLPDKGDEMPVDRPLNEKSAIEKAIAAAVGAAILASLIFLIKSKPWTWRINRQQFSINRFLSAADTKQKRIFLAATPVVSVIAIWLLIRDTHLFRYFDEIRFITMLFSVVAIILPVLVFTRLLDWINGSESL